MASSPSPKVGEVVRAVPVGQTRRQFIEVTRVGDGQVFGQLLSRKWPGNYRGRAVAWADSCEAVEMKSRVRAAGRTCWSLTALGATTFMSVLDAAASGMKATRSVSQRSGEGIY